MNKYAGVIAFTALSMLCASAYSQSQAEMNETSRADFDKADARLNVIYKKILATVDEEGRKKLVAAERAWLAYRDAEATFEADSERGGSMLR